VLVFIDGVCMILVIVCVRIHCFVMVGFCRFGCAGLFVRKLN